jgi:hypothetical protein
MLDRYISCIPVARLQYYVFLASPFVIWGEIS